MLESTFNALPDIVAGHGRHRPERPALRFRDQLWSWADLATLVEAARGNIVAAGVSPGDSVALLATNRPEAYVAALAALSAGAAVAPLSPLLTAQQLATVFADCEPALIFVDSQLAPLADAAFAAFAGDRVRRLPLDGLCTPPSPSAGPLVPSVAAPSDIATIIYSSGTTGDPKGIVHDHGARLIQAAGLAAEFGIDDRSVTLLATPLHTNGTWMMALPTIAAGGTCLLVDRFVPQEIADLMVDAGVTHMFAVPTMLAALAGELDARPRAFPAMRMCVSAGSALAPELKRRAHTMLGGRLGELYGLTEGIATLLKPDEVLDHINSVGRPAGGIDIVILDEEGRVLPPGETGEIAGRSGGMMRGYHRRDAATDALVWHDERGRIFLRTGDMGQFDDAGYLRITDRKRDMIVSGGLNIFSADLEAALRGHAAVADAAVIGVPHDKWGETPLGIIRLSAPADPADILAFANASLARHQRLSAVVVRESDYPRNLLGKVLKRELREEYP